VSIHVRRLIQQGESQHLDFKFEISDSRKIAKTLVAFANTGGGKLLVGVKDNGAIAGVRTEEEYYMLEAAANLYCKPRVPFGVKKWEIDGKTVLEVDVPKSELGPHYAQTPEKKWMVYVRVNDQNILANSVQLRVWKEKKKTSGVLIEYSQKEKLLLDYLENNELITISKFSRIAMISRKEAERVLINLISLDLVEIVFTEKLIFYRKSTKGSRSLTS
jgi:predicted HTH transcriptional regulator